MAYLMHYGTKRHSGRYPYGSGDNPYQHEGGLRGAVRELKGKGLSEKEIAEGWGMSIQELRDRMSIEHIQDRNLKHDKAVELFDKGWTYTQIAKEMGTTDNSIRSLLDPIKHERANVATRTAEVIKREIDANGATDIGKGMAQRMGISSTKLDTAIRMLQLEGYQPFNIPVTQTGTNKKFQIQVLAPPGVTWSEVTNNKDKINIVDDPYTEDGGKTWENIERPKSISSKRIYVRDKNEGGTDKDGLIEIRPGVVDLDIGRHGYAQVRIAVDDKYYMKGMAVYGTEKAFKGIPKGIDVIYNSNKDKKVDNPYKLMKRIGGDDKDESAPINWDNPFGASIKADKYDDDGNLVREVGQKHYIDANGKKQLSCINVVTEAGDWQNWSKRLSSQMLSKQTPALAEKQLTLAYEAKKREFEEINALTNPVVKAKLLASFADDCDSAAVHLKAAPIPGQQSHAIIPFPDMKKNEVYAPNYPNGTIVSLIRHPHSGIFEIPTLIVNNNVRECKKVLGPAPDAIGIHPSVASQLSGADFDGDTVIVIPNKDGRVIKSSPALEGLKDFDTKIWKKTEEQPKTGLYKRDANGRIISGDGFHEQKQMGMVSNLITDMTLIGAPPEEMVRAVKHSMVVIDAEKHNLDWRASEAEYNIKELKRKYQPGGGTGTLISRAKGEVRVPERKPFYISMIDKKTGEINWNAVDPATGEYKYLTGRNKRVWDPDTKQYIITDEPVMVKSTNMAEAKDAMELSAGHPMEIKYANFANSMKALANKARLEWVNLPHIHRNPEAAKKYEAEVESLKDKLSNAMKNKPLERKAQAIADIKINQLKAENPDWDKAEVKKHKALLLREARNRLGGGKRYRISITPREWEAIQHGAVTENLFKEILANTDIDIIRSYATPREYKPKLSSSQVAYAKSLLSSDNAHYTQSQVASMLGVSVSTLSRAMNGKE